MPKNKELETVGPTITNINTLDEKIVPNEKRTYYRVVNYGKDRLSLETTVMHGDEVISISTTEQNYIVIILDMLKKAVVEGLYK